MMDAHDIINIVDEHRDSPNYLEGLVLEQIVRECDFDTLANMILTMIPRAQDEILCRDIAEAIKLGHEGIAGQGMRNYLLKKIGESICCWISAYNRQEARDLIDDALQMIDEPARSAEWQAGFNAGERP